ncbi:hypothetical protein P280DRAFT_162855 [Massarina eburnea CBS 473.64]|uniref:Uncharacterized protein n=1 Tax=Massarina eburnea CBS 473.64 TaxID=1395130 RepID=A0A6A6RKC3_9PLEO|nr:hypothetical protein P280DRAFT_162855 [Massarina eburnea CBS 473.64]
MYLAPWGPFRGCGFLFDAARKADESEAGGCPWSCAFPRLLGSASLSGIIERSLHSNDCVTAAAVGLCDAVHISPWSRVVERCILAVCSPGWPASPLHNLISLRRPALRCPALPCAARQALAPWSVVAPALLRRRRSISLRYRGPSSIKGKMPGQSSRLLNKNARAPSPLPVSEVSPLLSLPSSRAIIVPLHKPYKPKHTGILSPELSHPACPHTHTHTRCGQ